MKKELYRAETRGGADHGWLKTRHSFSFADYYDPARMGFGALRVLNDDAIAPGSGFGKHPHSNMEIITIPLEGAVTHEDSMGNHGEVKRGEVQVMSAGSGVVHAEENKDPEKWLKLLQIWIETDPKFLDAAPRYKQKTFSPDERKNTWQLLVGPPHQGDLDILQETWIWRTSLEGGKELSYLLRNKNNNGIYLFVIEGAAEVAGVRLERRDALSVDGGESCECRAEEKSDILLIEAPLL